VIETRVAVCVDVSEQVPPVTAPQRKDAVVVDRSVAQLTSTWVPTRSVRYGARVRCGSNVVAAEAADALATPLIATTAHSTPPTMRRRAPRRVLPKFNRIVAPAFVDRTYAPATRTL
jgi:hypothetical protein